MQRLESSSFLALSAVGAAMFAVGVSLAAVACGVRAPSGDAPGPGAGSAAAPPSSVAARAVVVSAPSALSASAAAPGVASSSERRGVAVASAGLTVKRFVVASAIAAREPVLTGALVSDGQPIYAFAELENGGAAPLKLQLTFERKGASERESPVGHVVLTVPADRSRFRTWGNTRMIRTPGAWEAVLRSEAGQELGRASFEVS